MNGKNVEKLGYNRVFVCEADDGPEDPEKVDVRELPGFVVKCPSEYTGVLDGTTLKFVEQSSHMERVNCPEVIFYDDDEPIFWAQLIQLEESNLYGVYVYKEMVDERHPEVV